MTSDYIGPMVGLAGTAIAAGIARDAMDRSTGRRRAAAPKRRKPAKKRAAPKPRRVVAKKPTVKRKPAVRKPKPRAKARGKR